MAKTLSITIPEELYEKLQHIKKNRKGFNVSRICQEAIAGAVESEEELMAQEVRKDAEKLIEKFESQIEKFKQLKDEFEEKGIDVPPEFEWLLGKDKN